MFSSSRKNDASGGSNVFFGIEMLLPSVSTVNCERVCFALLLGCGYQIDNLDSETADRTTRSFRADRCIRLRARGKGMRADFWLPKLVRQRNTTHVLHLLSVIVLWRPEDCV